MGMVIDGVLAALIISMLAVFWALFHVFRKMIRRRKAPEVYRIAVVARLDDDHPLMRRFAQASHRLVFRVKDDYLVFPVKKNVFESYSEGDKGELLYRNDRFISFDVTGSDLPLFEERAEQVSDSSITFYGEARQLGIDIHSDRAKAVTIDEAIEWYHAFIDDSSDWFFVLSALDGAYVQVEHAKGGQAVLTYRNGQEESIKTCFPRDVETAIRTFYRDHDRD